MRHVSRIIVGIIVLFAFLYPTTGSFAQEKDQSAGPTIAEENDIIEACLDQYGTKPWKERPFVDYVVTMDFVTSSVDIAPKKYVAEGMFRACLKEAMQTGKIRYRPGMVGRALRHSPNSLDEVQTYSPKLTSKSVIRAMQLPTAPCVIRHLKHPFAGAILVSTKVKNGRAGRATVSASTFPKEFNECVEKLIPEQFYPVLKHEVKINSILVMQSSRR